MIIYALATWNEDEYEWEDQRFWTDNMFLSLEAAEERLAWLRKRHLECREEYMNESYKYRLQYHRVRKSVEESGITLREVNVRDMTPQYIRAFLNHCHLPTGVKFDPSNEEHTEISDLDLGYRLESFNLPDPGN